MTADQLMTMLQKLDVAYELQMKKGEDISRDDVVLLPFTKTSQLQCAFSSAKRKAGVTGW